MPGKIAVVGANGFVGRHLIELAIQRGLGVLGVVRSDAGREVVERLGGQPFLVPDLGKDGVGTLAQALSECQTLVYTASVSTGPWAKDRTDPSGLVNVLTASREAGVRRLIFFSGLGVAHFGINPHCTNSYFLAKMAGEVALFRSDLAATVFRPSYIFGAGDEFLSPLISRMAAESFVEIPGDGRYRLQPISVWDTARAILGAIDNDDLSPRVIDMVGPEALSYRELVHRIASIMGRPMEVRERPVEEALALSRGPGYFGLWPNDLACLLGDEISDSAAVESLVGSRLESVDTVIENTFAALKSRGTRA